MRWKVLEYYMHTAVPHACTAPLTTACATSFCKELPWSLSTFAANLFSGKKKKKRHVMRHKVLRPDVMWFLSRNFVQNKNDRFLLFPAITLRPVLHSWNWQTDTQVLFCFILGGQTWMTSSVLVFFSCLPTFSPSSHLLFIPCRFLLNQSNEIATVWSQNLEILYKSVKLINKCLIS